MNWFSPFYKPIQSVSKLYSLEYSKNTYMQCISSNAESSCQAYLKEAEKQKYKLQFVWSGHENSNFIAIFILVCVSLSLIIVLYDIVNVMREWRYSRDLYNFL